MLVQNNFLGIELHWVGQCGLGCVFVDGVMWCFDFLLVDWWSKYVPNRTYRCSVLTDSRKASEIHNQRGSYRWRSFQFQSCWFSRSVYWNFHQISPNAAPIQGAEVKNPWVFSGFFTQSILKYFFCGLKRIHIIHVRYIFDYTYIYHQNEPTYHLQESFQVWYFEVQLNELLVFWLSKLGQIQKSDVILNNQPRLFHNFREEPYTSNIPKHETRVQGVVSECDTSNILLFLSSYLPAFFLSFCLVWNWHFSRSLLEPPGLHCGD